MRSTSRKTGDVIRHRSVPAVSADDAVHASIAFDQLRVVGDAVYWLESRPHAEVSATLVRWHAGGTPIDVTPSWFGVGNDFHAYGGGSYAVRGEVAWCVGVEGLHRVIGGKVDPPVPGTSSVGDLVLGDGELLAVRESPSSDAIIAIPVNAGDDAPRVLAEASGFFSDPRPGPDALAWCWWSSSDMPWDGCEVWAAPYPAGGLIGDPVRVAGGPTESAVQPRWGPDGSLYFISDRSGWWNLHRWDGTSVVAVAPMPAECAAEPWEPGYATYDFLPDGRIVVAVQEGPRHRLVVVDPVGTVTPVESPYTSFKPYLAASGATVAVIGSSPTTAPQVALVRPNSSGQPIDVLARAEHPNLDRRTIAVPLDVRIPVDATRSVTAVIYPPTGAGPDWRSPVIVRAHPGPTASSVLRLDWQVQFFTSRGFAVVDVDYTGSTGYGRTFREALYGRWGIDDVADCRAVAEFLLAEGHAIAGQVFVQGASAGGYTALHAISEEGPFSAATAISAIADPDRWTLTVPRFQRAHAARLSGGAGRVSAATIRRPALLIHGMNDHIATAEDIRQLSTDMNRAKVQHRLLLLNGVGHYVASSRHAAAALEAELDHYNAVITAATE
jgi:dienelactone hydrolase